MLLLTKALKPDSQGQLLDLRVPHGVAFRPGFFSVEFWSPALAVNSEIAGDPRKSNTMPHRAYVLINVVPGQTPQVIKQLSEIKEIKTIDACWGKPDIVALAEAMDQESLTKLVLTQIHAIEGVAQTDTHLVYQFIR